LHCALCITHNPSGDLSKGEVNKKENEERKRRMNQQIKSK